MDAEDGTRIFRELAIGHRLPCQLEWTGTRYVIRVPLHSLRENTQMFALHRPSDMRDMNAEEEAIVIGLAQKVNLICEYQRGTMLVW